MERVSTLLTTVAESPTARADDYAETGRLLLEIGRDKTALYWLDRALERNPGNQQAHRALAAYHGRKGDADRAALSPCFATSPRTRPTRRRAGGSRTSARSSMGLDAGDPFGTGRPALWVTNYENELHALYRNECTRDRNFFIFATPVSGIAAIGQKFVGWGTGFVDVDHHGYEDLVIVNGHAIRYPTGASRRQRPVLLRNRDGKFKDVSPRGGTYFRQEHLARGLVLADLDNDGKVDLGVSHMNDPVAVLRNTAPDGNHWLGVELARKDHADVVGARVVLESGGRKQTRFAKGGGSYASSPDRRLVFGLGAAEKADKLTVFWPDGTQQEWTGLRTDCYHVLTQGEKEPREPGVKK